MNNNFRNFRSDRIRRVDLIELSEEICRILAKSLEQRLHEIVGYRETENHADIELRKVERNSELLTTEQAAEILGLKKKTLIAYRGQGFGPKVRKLGRTVRYKRDDVYKWIDEQQ